jgi:magnesium chelatase family protein
VAPPAPIRPPPGQVGPASEVWRGRPVFIGELGLDGSVRAVRGIIGKILAGRRGRITTFFIPTANLEQAHLVPGVSLIPVSDLSQLHDHLSGKTPCEPLNTGKGGPMATAAAGTAAGTPQIMLSDIVGQHQAKRALEIAAAGGHNILFDGPPGTGKSLLARALAGLLPPLDREEMLEVTHLHSLAGHDYGRIVTDRPFRAPHHGASLASITGGGSPLSPGEISLAHRGVLFFDELPEFSREAIETLRQPLESRLINVTRAHGSAEYPANFIFVATANPCPCGYLGSDRACECGQPQIKAYRSRLSGPILDRMDLYSSVSKVDYDRLLTRAADPEADAGAHSRIAQARVAQSMRFGNPVKLNAHMTDADVRRLADSTNPEAISILNGAAHNLNLSARGYMRTIKVARTIADLEHSTVISGSHLSEALNYRPSLNLDGDRVGLSL